MVNQLHVMKKIKSLQAYLKYLIFSRHAKGHGIHSPFLYKLIREVFSDRSFYPGYAIAERMMKKMLHHEEAIKINDLGAGSKISPLTERKISSIAKTSSIPKKYGRLLHRLVKFLKPDIIFELGTSLGISSAYMATGNEQTNIITVEGDSILAGIARENLQLAKLKNIQVWNNNFDDSISELQQNILSGFLLFIDGNHTYDAALKYFKSFSRFTNSNTIFIFDDIHWDNNMERCWNEIWQHPKTTLTIDLYRLGIVFFNKGFAKQHFTIRY